MKRLVAWLSILALALTSTAEAAGTNTYVFRYQQGRVAPTAVSDNPSNPNPPAPGSDQSIDAAFLAVVGEPFSAILPTRAGEVVAAWQLEKGDLPDGIEFDADTLTFSGTPTRKTPSTQLTMGGYSADGLRGTDAFVTFTVIEPGAGSVHADVYAHTGKYVLYEIPNPGHLPVVKWTLSMPLPDGMELRQTGHVSGIPSKSGVYPLSISGTNSLDEEIRSVNGQITVEDGPTVEQVADAFVRPDDDVSITPQVRRRVGELRWQVLGGPLPGTLRVNQDTGKITGQVRDFNVTSKLRLQVFDTDGTSGISNEFTIASGEPEIAMDDANDRQLIMGRFAGFGFKATDLSGAQNWSLEGGGLPAGLSLNTATGYISGIPVREETKEGVTVAVSTSDGGQSQTNPFNIEVVAPDSVPSPGDSAMGQDGDYQVRIGQPLATEEISMKGGVAPYTFQVAPGSSIPAGLALADETGVISGALAAPGRFPVSLLATDANGRKSAPFVIGIQAYNPLSVSVEEPVGQFARMQPMPMVRPVTAPDSVMTTREFPTPRFQAVGSLPPGLAVNSGTGAISGTPLLEGTFSNIRIQVTDASGETAVSNPFTITIGARLPLTVAPSITQIPRLANFTVRAATASNGIGQVTWTLASGTLPEGVTLRADGMLTGLTSATGTAGPIKVTATDEEGATATTAAFSFAIIVPDLEISAKNLTWAAGRPFGMPAPSIMGSVGSYTFSAQGLPPGATVNPSTGAVSGTVQAAGTYELTLSVTDELERTATSTAKLTIKPAMTIAASAGYTLNRASEGKVAPTAQNAIGNVLWSLAGSLPPGLSFNESNGSISGIPTEEGAWPGITVRATDGAGTLATASLSITIGNRLPLEVQVPETLTIYLDKNSGLPKKLAANNGVGRITWTLAGQLPPGVAFSTSTGTFSGKPTQAGYYPDITVTAKDEENVEASATFRFKATWSDHIQLTDPVIRQVRQGVWSTTPAIRPGNVLQPLVFSVANGGVLPGGLTLDPATGSVSGIFPNATREYGLTVTDALDASKAFTLRVSTVGALSVSIPETTAMNQHFPGSIRPTAANVVGTARYALSGTLPSGLAFDPATGSISGTPDQQGTWNGLSVTVTDSSGDTFTTPAFAITVGPRLPLSVTATATTAAIANKPFSMTPKAKNPVGQVVWSLEGTLPTGLQFNAVTGTVSGQPTTLGTWANIKFRATDSLGETSASAAVTISVITDGQPIGLTVYDLTAKADFPFSTRAPVVKNNVGDVTFNSFETGPAGLEIDSETGVITGLKHEAVTIPVNVYVTDSSNRLTSRALTINVMDHIQVVAPEFVDITVNKAAPVTVSTAANALGTVVWSMTGTLPSGMSFSTSTGRITGTPKELGEFDGIYITATDSIGDSATSGEVVIVVHDSGILPTVTLAQPGNLTEGVAFTLTPTITDSKVGDVYTLNKSLPDGLALNETTGRISGTPTASAPGVYEDLVMTLTASNGIMVQSNPITLKVGYASSFGFSTLQQRSRRGVAFTSSAPTRSGGFVGELTFSKYGTWPETLSVDPQTGVVTGSMNAGGSWTVRATDAMATKSFSFTYVAADLSVTMQNLQKASGKTVTSTPPNVANSIGPVHYSLVGTLPAGLSFDTVTGTISGTMPTATVNGLQIVATDDYGSAVSNLFSISPAIVDPTQFYITGRVGVEPNAVVSSDPVRIYGINAPAPMDVSNGADFRICAGAGTGCTEWMASGTPATIEWGEWFQVKAQAPNDFSTSSWFTATVGSVSADWSITTRAGNVNPLPFTFTSRVAVEPSTLVESNFTKIFGITDPAPAYTSEGAEFRTCAGSGTDCGPWVTSGHVGNFQFVQMRMETSSEFSVAKSATLDIGGVQDVWTVTTRATNAEPYPFAFASKVSAEPGEVVVSEAVRIAGLIDPVSVSVTEPAELQVCTEISTGCGAWSPSGVIASNQYLKLRMMSHHDWQSTVSATVTVGTRAAAWTITTRAENSSANFSFTSIPNAELSTYQYTDWIRITGLSSPTSIAVTSTSAGLPYAYYRVCTQEDPSLCEDLQFYSPSGSGRPTSIGNGSWVQMRVTAPDTYSTVVNRSMAIGTVSAGWKITTRAEKAVPDPFSFANVSNAELSTYQYTDWIRITGLSDLANIAVTSTSAGLPYAYYRVCTQEDPSLCEDLQFYSPSGSGRPTKIQNGNWVQMRVTSPDTYSTVVNRSMAIGTVSAGWKITTRAQKSVPNPFSFANVSNAELSTYQYTDWIRITGLSDPADIAVTATSAGLPYAYYRVCTQEDPSLCNDDNFYNSGSNGRPTKIQNDSWVQMRVTSPDAYSTVINRGMAIGGASAGWKITTRAEKAVPDPFSFADVSNAEVSTYQYTDWIKITGLSDPASIAVTAISSGPPLAYYRVCTKEDPSLCNDDDFYNSGSTGRPTKINPGTWVQMRVTAPATYGTVVNRAMAIGGVTASWKVTTKATP